MNKATALTQKGWTVIKPYKFYVAGVAAILTVSVIGFATLSSMDDKKEANVSSKQHVIDVAKSESDGKEVVLVKTTKDEYKSADFFAISTQQLLVNGKVIANFKTAAEAQSVLDQLKKKFTPTDGTVVKRMYFSEEVMIQEGHIALVDFKAYDTPETALGYIVKGTKEEKMHTVQQGENYWTIAQLYGINPYDLEKANPDIKAETIQIGQQISLVVPKPIISVCTVEEASYSEQVAFEVQYEESSNLYKGETKTKVNGIYGENAIVAEVIKENGREIGRTILSKQVVSEPTAKVVYKGTKAAPAKKGTGVLMRPASRGYVSSEFGVWRSYRRHTGIDVAMDIGNSVFAADGGTVTYAGYSSSYGKYIIVDHGGNMTTLYAHCSALYVTKGTKVYKGQTIAASGNSGNSTGPHLHFEVRINGVPKNPRNYVNF